MKTEKVVVKNGRITLPKAKVEKVKNSNKFAYLMFVQGNYSKLINKGGISKPVCDELLDKSNVYCVLVSKSQLIDFMRHNLIELMDDTAREAILSNLSISETNSFVIPEAFKSYFSVGEFCMKNNEIWETDALKRLDEYINLKTIKSGRNIGV